MILIVEQSELLQEQKKKQKIFSKKGKSTFIFLIK
jgi:hypothetical protein